MFWGLTPALDLILYYESNLNNSPDELNILIIGGFDSRHVLETLAKRYRHKPVKLNFYLVESCMESVAKQLLLLYVAFQTSENMALVQKVRTFMELYGNTLLRPAVAKYLRTTAQEFVDFVTNYEYMHEVLPYIDMDLKYKERDYMENIFKFWCSDDEFNICDCWDRRLRKTLGVRYDSKLGSFDWDLHMRFHYVGGKQVCNPEYRNFRLNGLAFTWLESEPTKTNRSLVCAVLANGENFAHYGYLGDMRTGPYIAYGLDCEDKNFLKSTNGINAYRATDVTERNLRQIFSELENQQEYVHQTTTDLNCGPVLTKASDVTVVDVRDSGDKTKKRCNKCIELGEASIKFISMDNAKRTSKYGAMFDIIYVGASNLQHIDAGFIREKAKNGTSLVILENQKFVLSLRDEDLKEHNKKIEDTLQDLELQAKPFDVLKDDYATFVLQNNK